MGRPQARLGDLNMYTAAGPAQKTVVPACLVNVAFGKTLAARALVDRALSGPVPPALPAPRPFVNGSTTVLINTTPALRVRDQCAFGGMATFGEFTVPTGG